MKVAVHKAVASSKVLSHFTNRRSSLSGSVHTTSADVDSAGGIDFDCWIEWFGRAAIEIDMAPKRGSASKFGRTRRVVSELLSSCRGRGPASLGLGLGFCNVMRVLVVEF